MAEKEKYTSVHVGYKSFLLILGMLLATVYTVLEFVVNWIKADAITVDMISKLATVWAVLLLVIVVIAYIAHMLWRLVFLAEEKYLK